MPIFQIHMKYLTHAQYHAKVYIAVRLCIYRLHDLPGKFSLEYRNEHTAGFELYFKIVA